MKHYNIVGRNAVHPFAFVQATDPAALPANYVTANKAWIDTSAGAGSYLIKVRNAANTGWETVTAPGGGGGGGVTDHGMLSGLSDDDHTQYHNDARGDARYYTKSAADSLFLTAAAADALFLTPAEGNALYAPIGGGGGVTDHGALTGLSDDDHTQYMQKVENAGPGIMSGGVITDGGSGTINVASATGYLRTTNSPTGAVAKVTVPATNSIALADGVQTYVMADYNGGAPQVVTSASLSNRYDRALLGIVQRVGSSVVITSSMLPAGNLGREVSRFLFLANGVVRVTGMITSETGTRNVINTAGIAYAGPDDYQLADVNTASGGIFTTWHRNGSGGFTSTASQTQYSNTNYDNGSGTLALIPSGAHGVHWVFRAVDGSLHLMYGQDSYTLAQAQAAALPASRPPKLQYWHAVFVAKIIVQRNDSVAKQIDIAFTSNIGAGTASDHGNLAGLGDDDHPQYHTDARGDARYPPLARMITVANSLSGGGSLAADRSIALVGDVASPGNSMLYGTNASGVRGWYAQPSGGAATAPGGSTTHVQYNNAGAFAGDNDFTWDAANNILSVGNPATSGIIQAPDAAATSNGTTLIVRGGAGGATSGAGGSLFLRGGLPGADGAGGGVTIRGQAGVGTNRGGGTITLQCGNGIGSGAGGSVDITCGTSPSGTAGSFKITTNGLERLEILGSGAWEVGASVGTTGQPLLSAAGVGPPTWGTLGVAGGGTGATTLTGYVKGAGTAALTASATIPYSDLSGTPTIPTGANPTASVGLAAVNGSAATFMRSDAAPALAQNIAPTWTQSHTFTVLANGLQGSVHLLSTQPGISWRNTAAGTNEKMWLAYMTGSSWKLGSFNDAGDLSADVIWASRTSYNTVSLQLARTNIVDWAVGGSVLALKGPDAYVAWYSDAANQTTRTGYMQMLAGGTVYIEAEKASSSIQLRVPAASGNGVLIVKGGSTYVILGDRGGNGVAAFYGTTNNSHFMYGANEDIYLRPGKATGTVYINDAAAATTQIGITGSVCSIYGAAISQSDDLRSNAFKGRTDTTYFLQPMGVNVAWSYGGWIASGAKNGWVGVGLDTTSMPSFLGNGSTWGFYAQGSGAAGWVWQFNGSRIAHSYGTDITGTLTVSASITCPTINAQSSRALKRETGRPRQARDILSRLRPIHYRMHKGETHEQLGLIAEEVHEVCPLLSVDGKSVAYDRLALLLLADWQEQHALYAEG